MWTVDPLGGRWFPSLCRCCSPNCSRSSTMPRSAPCWGGSAERTPGGHWDRRTIAFSVHPFHYRLFLRRQRRCCQALRAGGCPAPPHDGGRRVLPGPSGRIAPFVPLCRRLRSPAPAPALPGGRAASYLRGCCCSIPAQLVCSVSAAVLRSLGDSRGPLKKTPA